MILRLLTMHFIADFVLQSHWMATNKSKRLDALALHVSVYTACFMVFGLKYAIFNGMLHFLTDFFTSRLTSFLWAKKEVHWFFVAVGADQLIHFYCLILTFGLWWL